MADAPAHGPSTLGRFDPETALATLNSIGDAVVCTGPDWRVTFLNPVAERLTRWNGSDAIGRPLTEVLTVFDEDSGQTAINPASLSLRLDQSYIRESGLHLLARSGSAYDIGLSAAPIRTSDGAV